MVQFTNFGKRKKDFGLLICEMWGRKKKIRCIVKKFGGLQKFRTWLKFRAQLQFSWIPPRGNFFHFLNFIYHYLLTYTPKLHGKITFQIIVWLKQRYGTFNSSNRKQQQFYLNGHREDPGSDKDMKFYIYHLHTTKYNLA